MWVFFVYRRIFFSWFINRYTYVYKCIFADIDYSLGFCHNYRHYNREIISTYKQNAKKNKRWHSDFAEIAWIVQLWSLVVNRRCSLVYLLIFVFKFNHILRFSETISFGSMNWLEENVSQFSQLFSCYRYHHLSYILYLY